MGTRCPGVPGPPQSCWGQKGVQEGTNFQGRSVPAGWTGQFAVCWTSEEAPVPKGWGCGTGSPQGGGHKAVLHKGETRHCPKHVAGITSLLLCSCLSHFMERQLSPERVSGLPRVTQLVDGKLGF